MSTITLSMSWRSLSAGCNLCENQRAYCASYWRAIRFCYIIGYINILGEERNGKERKTADWQRRAVAGMCLIFLLRILKEKRVLPLVKAVGLALLSTRGKNNRLAVDIPADTQGTLRIWYEGNMLWRVTDAASLSTALCMLGLWLKKRRLH